MARNHFPYSISRILDKEPVRRGQQRGGEAATSPSVPDPIPYYQTPPTPLPNTAEPVREGGAAATSPSVHCQTPPTPLSNTAEPVREGGAAATSPSVHCQTPPTPLSNTAEPVREGQQQGGEAATSPSAQYQSSPTPLPNTAGTISEGMATGVQLAGAGVPLTPANYNSMPRQDNSEGSSPPDGMVVAGIQLVEADLLFTPANCCHMSQQGNTEETLPRAAAQWIVVPPLGGSVPLQLYSRPPPSQMPYTTGDRNAGRPRGPNSGYFRDRYSRLSAGSSGTNIHPTTTHLRVDQYQSQRRYFRPAQSSGMNTYSSTTPGTVNVYELRPQPWRDHPYASTPRYCLVPSTPIAYSNQPGEAPASPGTDLVVIISGNDQVAVPINEVRLVPYQRRPDLVVAYEYNTQEPRVKIYYNGSTRIPYDVRHERLVCPGLVCDRALYYFSDLR